MDDTQCGEKGTRKGKGIKDVNEKGKAKGKGKGQATEEVKRKGKGNHEGNRIKKQTPWGDDIYRAVALQWYKEMYKADSDTEG